MVSIITKRDFLETTIVKFRKMPLVLYFTLKNKWLILIYLLNNLKNKYLFLSIRGVYCSKSTIKTKYIILTVVMAQEKARTKYSVRFSAKTNSMIFVRTIWYCLSAHCSIYFFDNNSDFFIFLSPEISMLTLILYQS